MRPSEIRHYRIIRKLGAGGMGEVYLAEDPTLGRKVAIKMLSHRWAGSDQATQRLINEAKAAGRRAALDLERTRILEVKKKLYPRHKAATLGSIEDVFYALKKSVNGQTLGYIRLFSFEIEDTTAFVKKFTRLITKPDFPQDGLILDVRGNPGGNIRAAESLLQLFTPQRIEPALFVRTDRVRPRTA